MANLPLPLGRSPARARLLAAAESLFYEEGINAVGIDRIIERAGVAKASLYYCFGSKEELIRAYLRQRQTSREGRLSEALAQYGEPRDRLLGVFDFLGRSAAEPTFRGCAFVKAGIEAAAGSGIKDVCDDSRRWMRELFAGLAAAAGAGDAAGLAVQLAMLYDGASLSAQMDANPNAASEARRVAATLLDVAIAANRDTPGTHDDK